MAEAAARHRLPLIRGFREMTKRDIRAFSPVAMNFKRI
jgi:hypothetical protein